MTCNGQTFLMKHYCNREGIDNICEINRYYGLKLSLMPKSIFVESKLYLKSFLFANLVLESTKLFNCHLGYIDKLSLHYDSKRGILPFSM